MIFYIGFKSVSKQKNLNNVYIWNHMYQSIARNLHIKVVIVYIYGEHASKRRKCVKKWMIDFRDRINRINILKVMVAKACTILLHEASN